MKSVPQNKTRLSRNIVDPAQWDQSEVSTVAEARMQPQSAPGKRGDARVTSIRSSLFKRAAESAGGGAMSANQAPSGAECAIFWNSDDAKVLDGPLSSASSTSLQLCEYCKNAENTPWTRDFLALMHNGIRHEMRDLLTILQAVKHMRESLSINDFLELRRWWQTFSEIVEDYIRLEKNVLVPWIEDALHDKSVVEEKAFSLLRSIPSRHQSIVDEISQVGKPLQMLCKCAEPDSRAPQTPLRILATIVIDQLDKLIVGVADYFWEEETYFASPTARHYADERMDREHVIEDVVQCVIADGMKRTDEFFVLQTRWMADQKLAKAHVKYLQTLHHFSSSKLNSQFELQHGGIVAVFKVKGELD